MAEDSADSRDCPDDIELVKLVEGQLVEADADRLRRHTLQCTRCHEALAALAPLDALDGPEARSNAETLAAPTGRAPVGRDATASATAGVAAANAETVAAESGTADAIARGLLREGASVEAAPSTVGRTLDRRYRILRLLGKGAMGEVYEAQHTATGRHVAVKLINARLLALSEEARRRFKREAKAGGGVQSPHIVEVLDAGEDEATGDLFLAMELLRGEDLQSLIDRVGALAPDVALRVAAQALTGLARAHEVGVVHRDIKPANLFLARRDDGEITVKVLDFGIAKITERALKLAETAGVAETEGLLGTPLYMSPEAVQSSKDVDARSDLWSLGSVLYCALAGRAPFQHIESVGKMFFAIQASPPPPLRDRAPWVAPSVAEVVRRALKGERDKRYPSAEAMLDAIRGLLPDGLALRAEMLTGVPIEVRTGAGGALALKPSWHPPPSEPIVRPDSERPPPHLVPSRPAPPQGRLRSRWLRGAGAAVAVTALVAAVGYVRHDPSPPVGVPRRITSGPSWAAEPAISPDGKWVAYVSDEKGSADIWVVDASGGAPRRLTDDPAEDHTPNWFADGSAIAFSSDRGGQDGIWQVPVGGGPATLLVAGGSDPAVSPDGKRIAFSRADARSRSRIEVAPLADPGQATVLSSDDDGLWDNCHPVWSPDGSTLAYEDHSKVWIIPVAGGRARRLSPPRGADKRPTFSSDGHHLYFSSDREETVALWRLSTDDGQLARITLGTGPEVHPNVSRDGARLAYSTYVEESSLILVDLKSGSRAHMPDVDDFALAPNAGEVAYVSSRQAHFDLWAQPLGQRAPRGDPQRLTDVPGAIARPAFSPDGRWIAVQRSTEGGRDIWIMPAQGGALERITSDKAKHTQPVWSHDGALLAYLSDRSGNEELWTTPVADGRAAGEARQITFDRTVKNLPSWSPDGQAIAYETGGEISIALVSSGSGGKPRKLTSGAGVFCARWDGATGDIYASGTWGGRLKSIRRVSPSTGEARPLDPEVTFGNVALGLFEIALDGSTLAVRHEEARGDIWVLDAPKDRRY